MGIRNTLALAALCLWLRNVLVFVMRGVDELLYLCAKCVTLGYFYVILLGTAGVINT
jgi:hypothetical protein